MSGAASQTQQLGPAFPNFSSQCCRRCPFSRTPSCRALLSTPSSPCSFSPPYNSSVLSAHLFSAFSHDLPPPSPSQVGVLVLFVSNPSGASLLDSSFWSPHSAPGWCPPLSSSFPPPSGYHLFSAPHDLTLYFLSVWIVSSVSLCRVSRARLHSSPTEFCLNAHPHLQISVGSRLCSPLAFF